MIKRLLSLTFGSIALSGYVTEILFWNLRSTDARKAFVMQIGTPSDTGFRLSDRLELPSHHQESLIVAENFCGLAETGRISHAKRPAQ